MTMATAKKPKARPAPPPVYGMYRCYHEHPEFPGRPCNRLLGAGAGALECVCPRCHNRLVFTNPNDRG